MGTRRGSTAAVAFNPQHQCAAMRDNTRTSIVYELLTRLIHVQAMFVTVGNDPSTGLTDIFCNSMTFLTDEN